MKTLKKIVVPLCLLAVVSVYIAGNRHLRALRDALPSENRRAEALMVAPELLELVSGPLKGILSDYLLLKASIFVGGYYEAVDEDWETVWHLFHQSLYLDPYFFQTPYYSQAILAWRKGLHQKTADLLEISVKHRDWDWQPGFYAGFDYYYYLKNNPRAVELLRDAAAIPGAPPLVATLGARIARRVGRTENALALLHVMYDQTRDEAVREILKNRILAYRGIVVLETAVARYRGRFGKLPATLEALVTDGVLDRLPENPFTGDFFYNSASGHVSFDGME